MSWQRRARACPNKVCVKLLQAWVETGQGGSSGPENRNGPESKTATNVRGKVTNSSKTAHFEWGKKGFRAENHAADIWYTCRIAWWISTQEFRVRQPLIVPSPPPHCVPAHENRINVFLDEDLLKKLLKGILARQANVSEIFALVWLHPDQTGYFLRKTCTHTLRFHPNSQLVLRFLCLPLPASG